MPTQIDLDRATTAILAMDLQTSIVETYAGKDTDLVHRCEALLAAGRRADIPVIYIVVGFRSGFPEISPRNKSFSAIKGSDRFAPGDPRTAIYPALAAQSGEVVVTKHRVSAFHGTDLDMILRARGIDTLILSGIATSGVILSTLRHAADADYRLFVAEDCCADADPEVHRVLMSKVFPRQADIVASEAIVASLS